MNIGVDIVEHARINLKIKEKVLTKNEILQFNELKFKEKQIEYLASRFAAKEAIIKATDRKYNMREIEVLRTIGKPIVNIKNILLSISHEEKYSVAFCIYTGEK